MCFFKKTVERESPKVRVKDGQAKIVGDTLMVHGMTTCMIIAIAPSNSMDPVFDDGCHVIVDVSVPHTDLIPGDIVWFESPTFTAIHRIIKTNHDEEGWYCETQGDNNGKADGVKVRPTHIRGVYRGHIT